MASSTGVTRPWWSHHEPLRLIELSVLLAEIRTIRVRSSTGSRGKTSQRLGWPELDVHVDDSLNHP